MQHLERALDGQNQWWKYILVILIAFLGGNILGAIPLGVVVISSTLQNEGEITSNPDNFMDLSAFGIDPNLGLVLLMIPFIVSLIFLVLMAKTLHQRKLSDLINGTPSIKWSKFFFAFGIWGLLMILYVAVDYTLSPDNFNVRFDLSSFLPLIFISLLIIPFQASFEEILFRGYLAQGIGVWTRNRWLVILIPGLLFGLIHAYNPEVEAYGFWATMPQYILFGLVFGLITVLDDGAEIAMGAHSANNVFLSIFVTTEASALQTAALLEQKDVFPWKETVILILISAAFVWLMHYRYHWNFAVLNKKVEKATETDDQVNQ